MLNVHFIDVANFIFLFSTIICFIVVLLDRFYWKQYKDDEQELFIKLSYDFLPVLLVIMVFRTYMYEPFAIPSESMYPQLTQGDFIVVSKTSYSIKFPFTNKNIKELHTPQRGDVAVFQYPIDPSIYFIKRVVGLPNDKLTWDKNDMYINGVKVEREKAVIPGTTDVATGAHYEYETIGNSHHIIRKLGFNEVQNFQTLYDFVKMRSENEVSQAGGLPQENPTTMQITIPKDYYFVMGDNRDQSSDSRSWGLVHKDFFVGQAKYLVFHIDPKKPLWEFWKKFTFSRDRVIR